MRKLLIADSSDDMCYVLKLAFQKEFEVSTCRDGLTALALIKGMRPDILILDLFLPQLDGLTLLQQLQGNLPPVILVSTYCTSPYTYQMATDRGAGYILIRPFKASTAYGHIMDLIKLHFKAPSHFHGSPLCHSRPLDPAGI